jgi:serine/threonine protein kinase
VTFVTDSMCTKSVLDDFLRDVTAIRPKAVVKWFRPVLRYLHSLSPPIIHRKIDLSSISVRGASGSTSRRNAAAHPVQPLDDTARVLVRREAARVRHLVLRARRPDRDHEATAAGECATPLALVQKLSASERPAHRPVAVDLIGGCLQPPERRPTAEHLLSHPYFTRVDSVAQEASARPGIVVLFRDRHTAPAKPSSRSGRSGQSL